MKTVRLGLNLTEQFIKDPKVILRILRNSNMFYSIFKSYNLNIRTGILSQFSLDPK